MKSLLEAPSLRPEVPENRHLGLGTASPATFLRCSSPQLVGDAIDSPRPAFEKGSVDKGELLSYAGAIVGLTLIAGVLHVPDTADHHRDVPAHRARPAQRLPLSRIQKLQLSFFQNTPTGDLMAHATNDISAVRNVVGPGITKIYRTR